MQKILRFGCFGPIVNVLFLLGDKNIMSIQSSGFFSRFMRTIEGVFSPHPVPPVEIEKCLQRSRQCFARTAENIAEHKRVQAACEKTIAEIREFKF